MPRLFTGLEIPAEIGQTLSNLRGGLPGARWIDPENYHVTLRFIGDIDGIYANEIASMLFREYASASGVPAMPRLFTGLEIPAEIGQTLSSLRGGLPGARWIDRKSLV